MRRFHIFSIFLILFFGIASYSNTFGNSFVYDDIYVIEQNPYIRNLIQLDKLFEYNRARFVPMITFALNYKLFGLTPRSYHIVNLLIHLGTALGVYWLMVLITNRYSRHADLTPPSPVGRGGKGDEVFGYDIFPLFTSLLFVSHPIQTQAVTYATQRMTSLAALFFVLSLCLFISFIKSISKISILYLGLATLFALCAYFSKENSFTLPLIFIIVSIYFGLLQKAIRRRCIIGLTGLLLVTGISFYQTRIVPGGGTVIQSLSTYATGKQLDSSVFVLSQPSVLMHYVSLLVYPRGLTLDYDFPLQKSPLNIGVIFPLIMMIILLSPGVLMYRKNKMISFGILFFFITILPESSFIPIFDVIAEHRMYLPSFGLFLAFSAAFLSISNYLKINQTIKIAIIIIIVILLSVATYERNKVWQNDLTLYTDIVKKSPDKGKPHANLGAAYLKQNQLDKALEESLKALSLNFHYAYVYNNIGVIHQRRGNLEEAVSDYRKALEIEPGYPNAGNNLAVLYLSGRNFTEAVYVLEDVLKYHPDDAGSQNLLGVVLFDMGKKEEAIGHLQKAKELDPQNPQIRENLEKMKGE